jgi:hypothetical protein
MDPTLHSCNLAFGGAGASLHGAEAYYLFATLTLAGAVQEGAAGSIYESIANLECTIDPQAFGGGVGADCTFETGQ